jgi:anaerobic magnesium-protoporphyrin IX monomethyl ester cyclase
MRVTLVHPAGFNFVPGQPDFSVLANRMAPIGILQLAAWLERHGHPTAVHDCLGPHAPTGIEANAERVLATDPELVGISATTAGFMDAVDIAAHIKRQRPAVRTILGGVHASAIGGALLAHFPEIDYLCLGEGEGAMLDLADGKSTTDIANLVHRDGARIVANSRRERIRDLDQLPFPAYEKLAGFPHGYHLPLFASAHRLGATLITSRGCPYTCSFCDRTVFERRYRSNSAAYVYAHMKHLRDRFGIGHVNFYDDLFTAQQRRVTELCQLLIERPLGMRFNCIIRAGQTSPQLLQLLRRAGALMVSLGIESADAAMMARHKSGVDLDEVRRTVDQVHAAGLRAKGLFIFGLPGETPETFRATSDFILSLDLDDMNMTKFSPMYGAPIWDECVGGESGDFDEDWRLMNCLNFVFKPKGFASREQMDALYNWHLQRFYGGKAYHRRFARQLWQHRWSLWRVVKTLPTMIAAWRYFGTRGEQSATGMAPHARQPKGLRADLSAALQADARAALSPVKLSRRIRANAAEAAFAQCAGQAGET